MFEARTSALSDRTGGEILADGLIAQGADTVFGVPGESFLAVLDAIHERSDNLRFITCRQEGGAAFMADASGKLTGRPGVCLVTRGSGACNASIGVHTAWRDSTPMVLLIGQVGRHLREREAFQEVEYKHMFAPMAKWVGRGRKRRSPAGASEPCLPSGAIGPSRAGCSGFARGYAG